MIGGLALLVGFFGVPILVLMGGHRFRDRSPAQRRAFWGAVIGHTTGLAVAVYAALFPPVWWQDGWRAFFVHWSMLVGAILGVLIAQLAARGTPAAGD